MRWCLVGVLLFVCGSSHAFDGSVRVTPFDQVFPSLELSQARRSPSPTTADHVLGGDTGLIAVRVRAHHAGETVRLRIDAGELDEPGVVDAVLPQGDVDYQLSPRLHWNPARFGDTARATTLHLTLQRDGGPAQVLDKAVWLRPVSEALYFVREGRESVDLSWIFAAYVNEDDATAARVVDEALQTGIVDRFDGYGDEASVYRQVWAVWQALSRHGIRYSDADPGIARGPNEFSQRVRLLEETWNDRSANCIDGSVLITSVLQRIGLHSFLVLVPGHAFVGFYLDEGAHRAAYLETTLLGAAAPRVRALPSFTDAIASDAAHRSGIDGFVAALASGSARRARAASRLDGRHAPDYAVIDIGVARAFGIVPIAFATATSKQDGSMQSRRSSFP